MSKNLDYIQKNIDDKRKQMINSYMNLMCSENLKELYIFAERLFTGEWNMRGNIVKEKQERQN